jgi:hypothetical protein
VAGQGGLSTWAYMHVVGKHVHMHDCMGCMGLDSSGLLIPIHRCNEPRGHGPN